MRFRSKSSHKLNSNEDQFVSRLRFFDEPLNSPGLKRHSSAFLTPDNDEEQDQRLRHDLYGMRRRYNTTLDSEDTDFTGNSSTNGGRGVTFAKASPNKIRFSDQADMSTTSLSDDGFGFEGIYR